MSQPAEISVAAPLGPAMDWVKRMLFQPFDIGKWFTIGFCAWLAGLGESGEGFHSNYNFDSGHNKSRVEWHHEFDSARHYVIENLAWILPLAIAIAVILFAVGVVFVWLNSRGKFMFLHCVALDKAEVVEPWNKFSREGNSLFLFRLVLGIVAMILNLPLLIFAGIGFARMALHDQWNAVGIMISSALVLAVIGLAIVFAIIRKLTTDFVVPIMYLRRKNCVAAWQEFSHLLWSAFGQFVLYFLFQIVISMAIGMIVFAVVIITCCAAGCLLALPYLGTVLLLPVLIFKRAYSLFFFAQFGRDYDVFPPSSTPPPYYGFPSAKPSGI
jgi:hypothetical protein